MKFLSDFLVDGYLLCTDVMYRECKGVRSMVFVVEEFGKVGEKVEE